MSERHLLFYAKALFSSTFTYPNLKGFLSFDYEPTNNVKPNERLFDFHGCELDTENIKETFEVLDFDPDEYSDAPGQIVRTIFKGEELSTELLVFSISNTIFLMIISLSAEES